MPLDPTTMQREFQDVYASYTATPRESARRQAKAYDQYARNALAAGSTPVFTGSECTLLENVLYAAISSCKAGSPDRFAKAWADGVFAYWMGPPLQFSGGGILSGVVMAAPVQAVIMPKLTAVYSNIQGTAAATAMQQASALHMATQLVQATLIYPGAPPVTVVSPVT